MDIKTINFSEKASFIWSIADLLRGKYKQHEYGKIILPLTVLRRLDCVLEDTKDMVLKMSKEETSMSILLKRLKIELDLNFCNTSQYTFKKLLDDADNLVDNLNNYINGFSPNAKEILDYFKFQDEITKLEKNEILYLLVKDFAGIDLHPSRIANDTMGYIFEELIRKFSEQSNETAGEHFTPREVITLMSNILISCDDKEIYKDNIIKTIYDPACRNSEEC